MLWLNSIHRESPPRFFSILGGCFLSQVGFTGNEVNCLLLDLVFLLIHSFVCQISQCDLSPSLYYQSPLFFSTFFHSVCHLLIRYLLCSLLLPFSLMLEAS